MLLLAEGGDSFRIAMKEEIDEVLKSRNGIDGMVHVGTKQMNVPQRAEYYGLFKEKLGADISGGGIMEFKIVDPANDANLVVKQRSKLKKGTVCESKRASTIKSVYEALGVKYTDGKKEDMCSLLALELFKKQRLYLPPYCSPKN